MEKSHIIMEFVGLKNPIWLNVLIKNKNLQNTNEEIKKNLKFDSVQEIIDAL